LSLEDIESGLSRSVVRDQLALMRLRNTHPAFQGELESAEAESGQLRLAWRNGDEHAVLNADLRSHAFSISHSNGGRPEVTLTFD
jgi:sucrose phosphorylase